MKYLFAIFAPFLFLVSFCFPKNRKIWLYGAWFGQRYADNSKNLFEYANNVDDNIDIAHYWVYKNHNLKEEITTKGYKAVYAYSIYGIYLQLRAKVFITCVNSSDFIPFLVTPRNYMVQLYHGSPIKHIGKDSRKSGFRKFLDKIRSLTLDKYDLIVSPSELIDNVYISAFFSSKTKILRSGYPRNEMLFINDKVKHEIRNFFNNSETDKIIAYLPTHRHEGKGQSPFKTVLEQLIERNELLKKNGITIVVKPHYYERDSLKGVKSTSNVRIVYEMPFDLYNFLGSTNALITDYSSVMFDYELLGKPIFVFPFDYETYTKFDRGLYFDFDFIYKTVYNILRVQSMDNLIANMTTVNYERNNETSTASRFNVARNNYSKTIYLKIIDEVGE